MLSEPFRAIPMTSMTKILLTLALVPTLNGFATSIKAADMPADPWCDTWTATDAWARTLPGLPRSVRRARDKYVGMFYFLWLGQSGDLGTVRHLTRFWPKTLPRSQNPASPLWGPMHSPHHWGESIFGYYVSDDESVLRKHAQMLADAGVDAIFFDVTNQVTYPRAGKPSAACSTRSSARGTASADRLPLPVRRPAKGGPRALERSSTAQTSIPTSGSAGKASR